MSSNIDDVSILSVIADRAESLGKTTDPDELTELTDLVKRISDPEARRVAEILINRATPTPQDSPKVQLAVDGFRQWVRRNRTVHAPIARKGNRRR